VLNALECIDALQTFEMLVARTPDTQEGRAQLNPFVVVGSIATYHPKDLPGGIRTAIPSILQFSRSLLKVYVSS
jgi:hypothetical protein